MGKEPKHIPITAKHKRIARHIQLCHEQMLFCKLSGIHAKSENIKDVMEADIKAMEVYLSMGNSKSDAFATFCSVFKKSKVNKKRYDVLKKYIEAFDKNRKNDDG